MDPYITSERLRSIERILLQSLFQPYKGFGHKGSFIQQLSEDYIRSSFVCEIILVILPH